MNKTILVVDDCDMMRRFLVPVFKHDFRVISLNNPFDAILWLKTNPAPDMILLDYELPGMSGFEMLNHLRKSKAWANIPTIILSGVKDAEKRWQCLEAGANDFISKPFHPKELSLRVHLLMNRINAQKLTTPLNRSFMI